MLLCERLPRVRVGLAHDMQTNGRIPAGGPYYVVSRNLGAPFGAAIGFLFYIGTSLAATTYVLGAVEAFQTGFDLKGAFVFDTQIIALVVMFVLAFIVYVGVEWVSRTMYVFLAVVMVSILLGLGGLVAFGSGAQFGSTTSASASTTGPAWWPSFSPDIDTGITPNFQTLLALFYPSVTGIMAGSNRSGLLASPSKSIPVGTLSAIAVTSTLYILTVLLFGSIVDIATLKSDKLIFATVAWPVREVVTIGIIASSIGAGLQSLVGAPQLLATMLADDVLPFVPAIRSAGRSIAGCCCSCCGCSNGAAAARARASSDVRPSSSATAINAGPVIAQAAPDVSATVGSDRAHPAIDERFEDRFGTTDEGEVARVQQRRATMARQQAADAAAAGARPADDDDDDDAPGPEAASAGAGTAPDTDHMTTLSLDGAGSTHAQRTSAAHQGRGVAGLRELAITWALASVPCLAGNLDFITPIQTEAFLVMYLTINLAAFLNTFYYSPSFRPTWPVHWAVPAFGIVACLAVMLLVQWWQALLALAIAVGLHQWVRAGEQDDEWGAWGVSLASVTFGQASKALLELRDLPGTASTWRPQLLVLTSTTDSGEPTRPELVRLAGQLKKGKGVTMVTSVREERLVALLNRIREERFRAKARGHADELDDRPPLEVAVGDPQRNLQRFMRRCGVDGFAQLVVSPEAFPALETAIQTSGLSALRPNAVMIGWPRHWGESLSRAREFVLLCKSVLRLRKSLIAVKYDEAIAMDETPPASTIDLYWMGSDSGLILLLPFLLTRHNAWRHCHLRLFAVDPALSGRAAAVEEYLAAMRIPATVSIVPVEADIIDEALQGRTLTQDAAEELRVQLELARARGHLPGASSSPSEDALASSALASSSPPGKPGAVPAAQLGPADAATMTMVLGQAGHARRTSSATRRSVLDVFGMPDSRPPKASPGDGAAAAVGDVELSTPVPAIKRPAKMPALAEESEPASPDGEELPAPVTPPHPAGRGRGQQDAASSEHRGQDSRADRTTAEGERAGEEESSFVRSARRMNELIREHSSGAALVVASLMLSRDRDPEEFLRYTDIFCEGIPRVLLVRGTGQEVLSHMA